MLTDHAPGIGRLEHAATAGVMLLAAGSFVLSYDALHQLAATNHVPRPLAWIWPLIVDGFIITSSLAVLHAVLGKRSAIYPWVLLVAFSTMSVAFNVLHAPPTPVARLVAAIPPLTLVLSFELLMRQLRDRLSPSTTAEDAIEQPTTKPTATPMREPTKQAPVIAPPDTGSLLQQAHQLHMEYVERGTRLTGKALGEILGISDGYARRLLRTLNSSHAPA